MKHKPSRAIPLGNSTKIQTKHEKTALEAHFRFIHGRLTTEAT